MGAGLVTAEVNAPGGSITSAWGVVKLDALFVTGGTGTVFQGAAEVVTQNNLYLTLAGGGTSTAEITNPSGRPITTDVSVPGSPQLRQATDLYEIAGQMGLAKGAGKRNNGTIIGLNQF